MTGTTFVDRLHGLKKRYQQRLFNRDIPLFLLLGFSHSVLFPGCVSFKLPQSHYCKREHTREHKRSKATGRCRYILCKQFSSYQIKVCITDMKLLCVGWGSMVLILLPALVCSLLAVLTWTSISLSFSAQQSSSSDTLCWRAEGEQQTSLVNTVYQTLRNRIQCRNRKSPVIVRIRCIPSLKLL